MHLSVMCFSEYPSRHQYFTAQQTSARVGLQRVEIESEISQGIFLRVENESSGGIIES